MPHNVHPIAARHGRARRISAPLAPVYVPPVFGPDETSRRNGFYLVIGVMITAFAILAAFYLKMM